MSPNNIYRSNAQDCLRMAQAAPDERDKSFWLTLAQSWLRLAEHAAREGRRIGKPRASRRLGHALIAAVSFPGHGRSHPRLHSAFGCRVAAAASYCDDEWASARQSTLAPDALTTSAHFGISDFT